MVLKNTVHPGCPCWAPKIGAAGTFGHELGVLGWGLLTGRQICSSQSECHAFAAANIVCTFLFTLQLFLS